MLKRLVISLILILALSNQGWAAAYYFDGASGNDSTGNGSAASPYQTFTKANSLSAGGISGSTLYLKDGTEFRGIELALAGNNNITITSYKMVGGSPVSPGDSTNKPAVVTTTTITNLTATGWTNTSGTWTYTTSVFMHQTVGLYGSVYEDDIPLVNTAGGALSAGKFYWTGSSAPYTLHYKPSGGAGDSPANHRISGAEESNNNAGLPSSVYFTAGVSNYISFYGIKFVGSGIEIRNNLASVHDWTFDTCDFYYKGLWLWNDVGSFNMYYWSNVTIQYCKFYSCQSSSMSFEGADNGSTFANFNILHNNIIANGLYPSGDPWTYHWNDPDCIAIQNWSQSSIMYNDISGWVDNNNTAGYDGIVNGGITVFMGANGNANGYTIAGITGTTGSLITVQVTMYSPLYDGQRVAIWGVGNATLGASVNSGVKGVWTVTRVDNTHFTLNGSSFPAGGSYTASSGTARQESNLPQNGNVIAYNYIHDLTGYAEHAIQTSSGLNTYYASDVQFDIHSNIIARVANPGSGAYSKGIWCSGTQAAGRTKVVNNTIYGVDIGYQITGGNWLVCNNTINLSVSGGATVVVTTLVYPDGATNVIDYNFYDGMGTTDDAFIYSGNKTFSQWKSASGWDTNGNIGTVLYANASGTMTLADDFKPQLTSPTKGTGSHTYAPTVDYDGNAFANPPSIGALEYGTTVIHHHIGFW